MDRNTGVNFQPGVKRMGLFNAAREEAKWHDEAWFSMFMTYPIRGQKKKACWVYANGMVAVLYDRYYAKCLPFNLG